VLDSKYKNRPLAYITQMTKSEQTDF